MLIVNGMNPSSSQCVEVTDLVLRSTFGIERIYCSRKIWSVCITFTWTVVMVGKHGLGW